MNVLEGTQKLNSSSIDAMELPKKVFPSEKKWLRTGTVVIVEVRLTMESLT